MLDQLLPGLGAALDLHPIFVHFPIAFWLAALGFFAVGTVRDLEPARAAGRWLLYLGTAAAVVAVTTGYLATSRMGHEEPAHELVHVHRNIMLAATVIAVLASAVAEASRRRGGWLTQATLGLLLVLGAVATLGADRGARLVFGYGMGVVPAEDRAALPDHDHGEGHHQEHGEASHDHGGHDEAGVEHGEHAHEEHEEQGAGAAEGEDHAGAAQDHGGADEHAAKGHSHAEEGATGRDDPPRDHDHDHDHAGGE